MLVSGRPCAAGLRASRRQPRGGGPCASSWHSVAPRRVMLGVEHDQAVLSEIDDVAVVLDELGLKAVVGVIGGVNAKWRCRASSRFDNP